jgi:hypothetical protein
MGIIQIPTPLPAQQGIIPATKKMVTTDDLAVLTTAGYLNYSNLQGFSILPNDIIEVIYSYNINTSSGSFVICSPTIVEGIITLVPVVIGNNIELPTTADHIAVFADATGTLTEDVATAINGGNIQAGLSGTAGALASFPATASTGELKISATANSGNFVVDLTNAPFSQATVLTMHDPSTATANIAIAPHAMVDGNVVLASGINGLIQDSGFQIIADQTDIVNIDVDGYTFIAPGMLPSSIVTANTTTLENGVAIINIVPLTNQLTVTWSDPPGDGTSVFWIAVNFTNP